MQTISTKAVVCAAVAALLLSGSGASWANKSKGGYVQTNLVSDGSVPANFTDPNLVNPWGVAFFPGLSPFWVSDNNAGVSTLYDGTGAAFPPGSPLIVKIPSPTGPTGGTPTGLVANFFFGSGDFITPTTTGDSLFMFSTEDGDIVAWNLELADVTEAQIAVPNASQNAVYKGLEIASNEDGNFLFAANFRSGKVEVYDGKFQLTSLDGSFTDSKLQQGYAPFGIHLVNGNLWVTYAEQNAAKDNPVNRPAHGFVDVFDTEGNLVQRFAQHGHLNSPWGVAMAPASFGEFAGDVLIGNFGDGQINAYDASGKWLGTLSDPSGSPIVNESLWALNFGGAIGSSPDTLYFTAGLHNEEHGLFATLLPAP